MKKLNTIKQISTHILVILYEIISVFWCYIIINNIVYSHFRVYAEHESIGIIGGADTPTMMFIMGELLKWNFSILFVIICIVTIFILNFSLFKKKVSKKFNKILCVFSVLSLIVFMLVPAQSYAVSLYTVFRILPFTKYIQIIYIIVSIMVVAINLFLINSKIKESNYD